jgi:hypothetical protein
MHATLRKASASRAMPNASSRRMRCKSTLSDKITELVNKRKELDKSRVQKLKEIGNTVHHIASAEVRYTKDVIQEVLPFLDKIEDEIFTKKCEKCEDKPEKKTISQRL